VRLKSQSRGLIASPSREAVRDAVAIGLVVDDAIVIVEAIAHHRELGEEPLRAAALGTTELAPAVIGTTPTTVVVLVPLSFLNGIVGDFFRALAFTLTSAVLISLVIALTLIPLSGVGGVARLQPPREPRWQRLYQRLTRTFLRRPMFALALVLSTLLVGTLIFPQLKRGFLPSMDEGAFVLDYHPGDARRATSARPWDGRRGRSAEAPSNCRHLWARQLDGSHARATALARPRCATAREARAPRERLGPAHHQEPPSLRIGDVHVAVCVGNGVPRPHRSLARCDDREIAAVTDVRNR